MTVPAIPTIPAIPEKFIITLHGTDPKNIVSALRDAVTKLDAAIDAMQNVDAIPHSRDYRDKVEYDQARYAYGINRLAIMEVKRNLLSYALRVQGEVANTPA